MRHRVVRRAPVALAALAAATLLCLAGCVPRDRVNASCAWREAQPEASREGAAALGVGLGPLGARTRRAHLAADADLAQELGVRYADSAVGRPPPSMPDWVHAQEACTARAFAAAAGAHALEGVTAAEVAALRGARVPGASLWWFDLLAVALPVGVLCGLVSRAVAARVVGPQAAAGGDGSWGSAAVLGALTPVVAVVGLQLAGLWAASAEMLRLRDNHISYRGPQLLPGRHPVLVAVGIAVVFAAAAVRATRAARRAARSNPLGRARPPAGSTALKLRPR